MFAEGGKFGEDVWGRVRDEEVEGVVGVAILKCFDLGLLQDGEEGGIAFALGCECHLQIFTLAVLFRDGHWVSRQGACILEIYPKTLVWKFGTDMKKLLGH